jgi:hypothetical protein
MVLNKQIRNRVLFQSGLKNLMTQMSKPSALRPFLLLMAMFSLQQGCGTFAVVFYAVNVFQVRHLHRQIAIKIKTLSHLKSNEK